MGSKARFFILKRITSTLINLSFLVLQPWLLYGLNKKPATENSRDRILFDFQLLRYLRGRLQYTRRQRSLVS